LKRETRAPSVGSSKHSSHNGSLNSAVENNAPNTPSSVPLLGLSKATSLISTTQQKSDDKSSTSSQPTGRKFSVFIGGLTWWTTDEDIKKLLDGIGIDDIHEIKFYDNRANGQSKGFCSVAFLSDASAKTSIEKLGEM